MIPLETDKCAMRNHRLTDAVRLTSLFWEAKRGKKSEKWREAVTEGRYETKILSLPALPKAGV